MICKGCAHENPAGAKFCEECGTPAGIACASCGAELRATVKFCSECGTPVVAGAVGGTPAPTSQPAPAAMPATPVGTRKIVTIVFADLAGSTAMQERLDPESVRLFMESYYDAMREAVEAEGGTVTQFLGDGVKAVFGIPRVAEDDAIRAVRAGVAMHQAFQALAENQRGAVGAVGLRVAVNTGEVVANADDEIIGDPVNVAARLQEQGGNGDVVVGDSTARLVENLVTLAPLGSFSLKGRAETVAAFLVESLDPPAGAATAAFVGRDEEIIRLTLVYENAIEQPATSLAILLGSPGLGKSRLIDEFSRRLGDAAQVVEAHCDQANGATFAPLAVALRGLLGIDAGASGDELKDAALAVIPEDDRDRERIASGIAALLAGAPGSLEETFFVVRRLFASIASVRPLVLVIDDLQWAEPLLIDLVEHLVQWGSGVPMLVLVGARPELRDKRASLTVPGGLVSDVVTLSGLDAGAAMRLAANVIGAESLPAAVAAKVLATSEGNPLFVGELVRMLVHEGALTREGDRWTTGTALAALEMPPTIHALLAARIERLQPDERVILERASIVGRHFSRSAVLELLPPGIANLDDHLETLRRSELIERDTGWFFGEPVLRFHHVLIRDAAYRQLLKGTRAELHTTFADWALERAEGSAEHDETIGWHLEQAHQFLRELGPIDANGRVIGERASKHLAAAGTRALGGDDVSLAGSLLGRAIDRLDPDDNARAELSLDWCEALLASGDVGPAVGAIEELDRFVGDSERLRAWHTCFAGQHTVLTAPDGLQSTADTVAAAAKKLAALDDAAGEAKAHYVYALALSSLGKIGACEAALDRALAAARRVAGDRRRANTVLAIAPLAALSGPSPVTRASGRCLDVVRVLRITQGAPAVEAVALSCQGVLEALRGRTDAARRMIASARTMVEELGITQRLLEIDVFSGQVDLLEGDAVAAEASLRGAYDGLRELGLGIDAAKAAALLARALLVQGRDDEAEALSHESESLAGDDLKAAIAWRGVRAEALARRGEHTDAVAFASKAVEIAAATDALLDHADARLALAAALRAAGRGREADAEERRAHELWEAKGATLLAERARVEAANAVPIAEPSAEPIVVPAARTRRVDENAATAMLVSFELAVAARDLSALRAHFTDDYFEIDHPTGATFGREEAVASMRRLLESKDPHYKAVPLATLGESLVLMRRVWGARGAVSRKYDVGEYENEVLHLMEVEEHGLIRHSEVFVSERIVDAIVCLYERYAASLPEGPARTRANSAAQTVAAWLGPIDHDRLAATIAPSATLADHRVLATWTSNDAAELLQHMRTQTKLAPDFGPHVEEICGLAPDMILVRGTYSGHSSVSGGYFGNEVQVLYAFRADGLLSHVDSYEAEAEAAAVARFEALRRVPDSGRSLPRKVASPTPDDRVPANAATAMVARHVACATARDFAGVAELFSADHVEIDHSTGASYGIEECLVSLKTLYRSRDPRYVVTPLAVLGGSLALMSRISSASGARSKNYDVGPYENQMVQVFELDERGLIHRAEAFSPTRLRDAIVCLYQLYAESLPEGEEQVQARAVARAVDVITGPIDLDRMATVYAPAVRLIDHRVLFTWSAANAAEHLEHLRLQLELAPDFAVRTEELLAAGPNAYLLRITFYGNAVDSGGYFENKVCALFFLDDDGRIAHMEAFEAEDDGAAIARFDELTGAAGEAGVSRRRVRPNRASEAMSRMEALVAARNFDGVKQLIHESHTATEHPTGASFGRDGAVASVERLCRGQDSHFELTPLATLGDSLALAKRKAGASGTVTANFDVGAHEIETFNIFEVNSQGLICRSEVFAETQLVEAVSRLYAWYAELLPEGREMDRAVSTARTVAGMGGGDLIRFQEALSPTAELVDHRTLGQGTMRGAGEIRAWARAMEEVEEFEIHYGDVLCLEPNAALMQTLTTGTARTGGGEYERVMWAVWTFAEDGLLEHLEFFDPTAEAEALARFDALTSVSQDTTHFANSAFRINERTVALWMAGDRQGLGECLSADFRLDDRRRLALVGLDKEGFLESQRTFGDMPSKHIDFELIATRGDRLALFRETVSVEGGDIGPSVASFLRLTELNGDALLIVDVRFDEDNLVAAYAELDARFEAQGAAHPQTWASIRDFVAHVAARNWDAVAAICTEELVEYDHRGLAVLGTTHGNTAWARNFSTLVDLVPDTIYRVHHFVPTDRGYYVHGGWYGSQDGGPYEVPLNAVLELDDRGLIMRADIYDDNVDAALTRLAELTTPVAEPAPFENAAWRASERYAAIWLDRDWDGALEILAREFRLYDRRRFAQLELDREQFIEDARTHGEMESTHVQGELLATRGERLALTRRTVTFSGGDVGPSELVNVTVFETDGRGDLVAIVRYDEIDLDVAYAELDARFDAGEGAAYPASRKVLSEFFRGIGEKDWDALIEICHPDMVEYDRRSLAVLGATRGAEAWAASCRALVELAPDTVFRSHHFFPAARGYYMPGGWYGTREGSDYEMTLNPVVEFDDDGRIVQIDLYDDGDEAALARLAELDARAAELDSHAAPNSSADLIKPNAATRAMYQWLETNDRGFETGDWEPMRALCPPNFVFEDRRRMALLKGDREMMIASARERAASGARIRFEFLGTGGDRVAMGRVLWAGGPADGRFEIEYFFLCEVDEAGTLIAFVLIDLDSPGALREEAWARWAAVDPNVAPATEPLVRMTDAFNEQDVEKWRGELSDDLVVDDHRLAGMGRLQGPDAYTESIIELWRLAPDTHARVGWVWPAFDHYGGITVVHRTGTVPDGGGDFESEYLYLFIVADRRITHLEMFELRSLDQALARFKELGADPLLIPPNTSVHAQDRCLQHIFAGEWASLRTCVRPDFVFEDRGKRALVTGDIETWIASAKFTLSLPGVTVKTPLLGTVGDRISVSDLNWYGSSDGDAFDVRHLRLTEIDADGLLRALIVFDPEDRAAAFAEAHARFQAGEAAGCPAQTVINEMLQGYNSRDWALLQRRIAEDSVFDDHRPLSFGCISRDQWIESSRVQFELAPDTHAESFRTLAWNEHGRVLLGRIYGTRDGGEFENVILNVEMADATCVRHREVFAPEDADRALARFEELCREPSQEARGALAKENAASAMSDHLLPLFDECASTDNWEPLRAIYAPDSTFEDRQSRAMLSGDLDMTIGSLRERAAIGARVVVTLLGTFGDRVSVSRMSWTGGPPDGRFEIDYLALIEVNAEGLICSIVLFDDDDPRAAQREAGARWAALDPRATDVVDALGRAVDGFNEKDVAGMRANVADALVFHDHRLAGLGRVEGTDNYITSLIELWKLAPITKLELGWVWYAFDHHGGVTLARRTGTVPGGGGDFESEFLYLFILSDGRIAHAEAFEVEALDEALARFKEIGADPLLIPPNAATRSRDIFNKPIYEGDWDGLRAFGRPDFVFEDRGRRALVKGDIETFIESARYVTQLPGVQIFSELIGTVGDRIALWKLRWSGPEGGDAFEVDRIRLVEVDADGLLQAVFLFDPEDRAAAFAEAHARFRAGEAAGVPAQAVIDDLLYGWASKDWALMRRRLAEDIVVDDHRPLSFGRIDREQWIESWRVGVELAPDVTADWYRTLAWNEHGRVWLGRVHGTREGGAFENIFITVGVADASHVRHYEFFPANDVDLALERFHELTYAPVSETAQTANLPAAFENAATLAFARACDALGGRDWPGFQQMFAPNCVRLDRRALVQLETDRETWLASFREILEMTTSSAKRHVVATRGERLAMVRLLWQGEAGDMGPSEIETLLIIEVDERGDHTAVVTFDPSDLDAAREELDARWATGDAALHPRAFAWLAAFRRGFVDRDWDAMASLGAQDEVAINHRLVGWGTLRGKGAWAPTLKALADLAEDATFPVYHVRTCDRGIFVRGDLSGTRDGGPFEIPELLVVELNKEGQSVQLDVWDDLDIDEALARFEALQPDPLRIPPNAAMRVLRQIGATRFTGGIEALRDVTTDDFCFDDRQRRSLVKGGVDEWLRALDFLWSEIRARQESIAIATSGDRLLLDAVRWSETPGDAPFEMEERLRVVEVDEAGKLRAMVFFDADDRAAAHTELFERYVALGAEGMPEGAIEFNRSVNTRDLDRSRASLCDDCVVDDRRRTGMGLLEGADAYIESIRAYQELTPDARVDALHELRVASNGRIFLSRTFGRNTEGGEFESIFLVMQLYRDEKIARMEFFELEHVDAALARFEELVSASAGIQEQS